jgi:NAD(P)H dehydrogenase (quinone)
MTASVAVVYHSASGRTKALAEAVARGATEAAGDDGLVTHVLSVEEAARAHAVLAAADAIVFGCPTYMGSASAAFKTFMDGTAAVWALQGWRDKLAAGFTHSAALSGDKLSTLTQLAVFAAQHGMVWVGLGLPPTYVGSDSGDADMNRLGSHLGAMGQSRPGGGKLPLGDVKTAEHLGKRVALAALRWRRGEAVASTRPTAHTSPGLGPTSAPRPSVSAGPAPMPSPGIGPTSSAGSSDRQTPSAGMSARHPTTRSWGFPPAERPPLEGGIERTNLRELAARPNRYEHHLMVCATIDGVQLEIATASEPLYFSHINVSDEYALALPTGDELVDRFPLRTFLSDPNTGADVGRYNHRISDLVLHPEGFLHWPGRLRPPYEPFEIPPGMRRCGLSLVYCASKPTPATWCPLPRPIDREEDAKAYVTPSPPMVLASMRGEACALARIGRTTLSLIELPVTIAPAHGGWVVVLEVEAGSTFAPCDLLRIPEGATLESAGIVRALLLTSDEKGPDAPPPIWNVEPEAPFAPYEEVPAVALPLEHAGLRIEEVSAATVAIAIGDAKTETPRYWLARMLHRVALHGLRMGYAETYGGFFVDDREEEIRMGVRATDGNPEAVVRLERTAALAAVERMYRAVAPAGYRERLT